MKKREQILLILLAALLILLGGFKFLIEPQISALNIAKEELEQAQAEKQKAEDNVLRAEIVLKENTNLEEKIIEAYEIFFPELKNNKVHVFFDSIATSVGIEYISFTMAPKLAATISHPQVSENIISYPAKDRAEAINITNGREEPKQSTGDDGEKSKDDDKDKTELEKMNVNINFNGTYTQMKSYLDAIKNSNRTVRVISVNSSSDSDGLLNVSVALECFAIKKISNDSFLDDTLANPSGKPNPFS